MCAFDSIPLNIDNIDDEKKGNNNIWSAIYVLPSLRVSIKSSILTEDQIHDAEGAFFKVHACKKWQKAYLFREIWYQAKAIEPLEFDKESLEFYKPNPRIISTMKNMSYDFKRKLGLNFGKGSNSTSSTDPKRKGYWLLWQNKKRVRVCVRPNHLRIRLWWISESWPFIQHFVMELSCQRWSGLQSSLHQRG